MIEQKKNVMKMSSKRKSKKSEENVRTVDECLVLCSKCRENTYLMGRQKPAVFARVTRHDGVGPTGRGRRRERFEMGLDLLLLLLGGCRGRRYGRCRMFLLLFLLQKLLRGHTYLFVVLGLPGADLLQAEVLGRVHYFGSRSGGGYHSRRFGRIARSCCACRVGRIGRRRGTDRRTTAKNRCFG